MIKMKEEGNKREESKRQIGNIKRLKCRQCAEFLYFRANNTKRRYKINIRHVLTFKKNKACNQVT